MRNKLQLDKALRKNRGLQIRSKWITKLLEVAGIKLTDKDFLTIEETEILKQSFFDQVKNVKDVIHQNFPIHSLKDFLSKAQDLAINFHNRPVIVFNDVDKYIGAVRLSGEQIFPNLENIWDVTGEDLCITTPDIKDGLCLEFNLYSNAGEYVKEGVFEFFVWGEFKKIIK